MHSRPAPRWPLAPPPRPKTEPHCVAPRPGRQGPDLQPPHLAWPLWPSSPQAPRGSSKLRKANSKLSGQHPSQPPNPRPACPNALLGGLSVAWAMLGALGSCHPEKRLWPEKTADPLRGRLAVGFAGSMWDPAITAAQEATSALTPPKDSAAQPREGSRPRAGLRSRERVPPDRVSTCQPLRDSEAMRRGRDRRLQRSCAGPGAQAAPTAPTSLRS